MKLRWPRLALADFENAHDYIAENDPQAARRVAERILAATARLLDNPRIGHPAEDETTREWQVPNTPYLPIYRIRDNVIELLRVWHTRRSRRSAAQSTDVRHR